MIMGIDVGYSNTKVCSKEGVDIFRSTVAQGIVDINKSIQIEFQGKEYTIGENNGIFSVKINKINDIAFKLCLFTAIARNLRNGDENVELVTGLPVQYYKEQKSELKESLEGVSVNMMINDKPIHFSIIKCVVFPQSAGLFVLKPEKFSGDNIVIDIGGMTVDVSYFNNMTLQDYRTYELGMIKLYDKIVQNIKAEYGISYDLLHAQNIIDSKEVIKDGQIVDCSDLVNQTLKSHAQLIINRVSAGLDQYDTSKRQFIGGGAYILRDYLPTEVSQDDIYSNARAFYQIGVDKFEN
ncbi:MAG: ParM/StbA family protein [Bacillota bacterium]|nr:ParM/StbA family protein [Bacillota bacterium]